MSAPLAGALNDAIRFLVLGGEVRSLSRKIRYWLVRRRWLSKGGATITRLGHKVLASDGDTALQDIRSWLKSTEAEKFFQK